MGTSDIRLADLTGRARIRRAALHLFAAEGYAQTSLRSIATEAQVSLALIAHHFGSKHQLRDAIDGWVLAMFEKAAVDVASNERAAADGSLGTAFAGMIGDIMAAHPEIRGYLRRMTVVDAAPNGIALLGSLMASARGIMQNSPHPCSEQQIAAQSLQFLLLALGPSLLEPLLQRYVPDLFAESAFQQRAAPEPKTPQPVRFGAAATAADVARPLRPAAYA